MKNYFEKIINVIGIALAIAEYFCSTFSLEIKLLVFVVLLFITVLISYIHSFIRCYKLSKTNEQLVKENSSLKEELSKCTQTISTQKQQINSYISDTNNNKIEII